MEASRVTAGLVEPLEDHQGSDGGDEAVQLEQQVHAQSAAEVEEQEERMAA